MADITLTANMRSNLLSLQQTQSLMDMTQERLSTGKKVNSAIDNPSSYYTAQALNNRAADLENLLDNMGQGIQIIKAANEAIETITSFAGQAKAVAGSALDIAGNFDKYAVSSAPIETEYNGNFIIDAREDLSRFEITVADADDDKKITVFTSDGKITELSTITGNVEAIQADLAGKFQALGLNAVLSAGGKISVSTTDRTNVSWLNGSKTGAVDPYDNGIAAAASAAGIVTLNHVSNSAAASSAVKDSLAATNLDGIVKAGADGKKLVISAPQYEFQIFTDNRDADAADIDALGLSVRRKAGNPDLISEQRKSYAEQFNEILSQIDQLAKDANYKGINLLQENNLKVVFNENSSSAIEIKGVDGSAKGLGIALSNNDWQKDSDIETSIADVEQAVSKLRSYAADFGNNYAIVQGRETFTDSLINVLTEGADKLTLADMNEESANMLALQTRQQLAINSLSLASQAAQSVLKLF